MKVVLFDVNGTLIDNPGAKDEEIKAVIDRLREVGITPIAWSAVPTPLFLQRIQEVYGTTFDGIYNKDTRDVSQVWDPVAFVDDDPNWLKLFRRMFPQAVVMHAGVMVEGLNTLVNILWNKKLD